MIEFTPEDKNLLSIYLDQTKSKLLLYLRATLPKVVSKTIEAAALEAKERQGAEDLITKIEELAAIDNKSTPSESSYDITSGIPR